jgi:hypothetical protein
LAPPLPEDNQKLPPREKTLILFLILVCDWRLFEAVFGTDPTMPKFDYELIFRKYEDLKRDLYDAAIEDIRNLVDDIAAARAAWFNIVGCDYTGSACPDTTNVSRTVVFIEKL